MEGRESQSVQRIKPPSDYALPSTGTYYTRHQVPRAQCHFELEVSSEILRVMESEETRGRLRSVDGLKLAFATDKPRVDKRSKSFFFFLT